MGQQRLQQKGADEEQEQENNPEEESRSKSVPTQFPVLPLDGSRHDALHEVLLNERVDQQDRRDAESLYHQLENSVVPAFYERDERGIPTRWVRFMRNAMKELVADFSAARMVADYAEQMYSATDEAVPIGSESS